MGKATQIERSIDLGQVAQYMFSQDAAADAQAAVAMNILEVAATVLTTTEYVIPWEFSVVGIGVVSDLARTAGTLTADATINGTVTGVQGILDATNTFRDTGLSPRGAAVGAAGDRIGVKLTTASWTPVTADIVVVVYAILGLEGI